MEKSLSIKDILRDSEKRNLIWKQYASNDNEISLVEKLAYVSHFLQNIDNCYPYSQKAILYLNEILDINLDDTETGLVSEYEGIPYNLFPEISAPKFPSIDVPKFNFIDLFAGIGGFRLALQNLGGKCIFSSEWDSDAQKTYFNNFGEIPFGDITKREIKNCIPEKFDVLCAGFPCQAFSIAGYRKGFNDTRGTLFFDVATILKEHQPKAFFLENVKNLKAHDNGNTFKVIENTLKELGYVIYTDVLNTMEYVNIPQNRERIFIVGFDPSQVPNYINFKFPQKEDLTHGIGDFINYDEQEESLFYREDSRYYPFLKEAMVNPNTVYQWRRQYVRENQSNVCPTLTANMGTGGHNVPLIITDKGFRKLTPKECLNFQGYPTNYSFPNIAKSKQYKQAGNSVTVPLIQKVASNIIKLL